MTRNDTPEWTRRLQQIFEAAIELEQSRRAAFLGEACDDPELRREVEALLAAAEEVDTRVVFPDLFQTHRAGSARVEVWPPGRLAKGLVIDGTYRVIAPVGEGGMGEVYEVAHLRLAGRYAIKVLRGHIAGQADAFERFKREAEITSSLRHPNIVHVLDFSRVPEGAPYIAMEFLEGESLAGRIRRAGPLSLEETAAVVEQVASALAAAHSRDIVHRDLKPQNVFLAPLPGQARVLAKVVDFGISKIRALNKSLTRESALVGTPQYMAPEQAAGRNDAIAPSTDQFALAAIAWEMLSGRPPFQAEDAHAVLHQIINDDPAPLAIAGVPRSKLRAMRKVLLRALRKQQHKRFAHILAFAEAFVVAARDGAPHSSQRRAGETTEGRLAVAAPGAGRVTTADTSGEVVPRPRPIGAHATRLRLGVAAGVVAVAAALLGLRWRPREPSAGGPDGPPGIAPARVPEVVRAKALVPASSVEPPLPTHGSRSETSARPAPPTRRSAKRLSAHQTQPRHRVAPRSPEDRTSHPVATTGQTILQDSEPVQRQPDAGEAAEHDAAVTGDAPKHFLPRLKGLSR